jgi:hypothetical protein
MSEPKQIPEEIKKEAANLEMDRLKEQVSEGAVLLQQVLMRADLDSKVGSRLASALVEIVNIKGSPPIQVSRTIAQKAIDDAAQCVQEFYAKHYNPDENLPAEKLSNRPEEHEA